MRFITKMGLDNRGFAAALVNMGVKGHVKLTEEDGGWLSGDKRLIHRLAGAEQLSVEEEAVLPELGQVGETIEMKQANHARFSAAKKALADNLKTRYEGTMFARNTGWAAAGVLIVAAAIWMAAVAVVAATGGANAWQAGVTLGCLAFAATMTALVQTS
jgi:hypothetical protein